MTSTQSSITTQMDTYNNASLSGSLPVIQIWPYQSTVQLMETETTHSIPHLIRHAAVECEQTVYEVP